MKSKFLKYFVLASSLAFMNCGDSESDVAAALNNLAQTSSDSGSFPGVASSSDATDLLATSSETNIFYLSSDGNVSPVTSSETIENPVVASSAEMSIAEGSSDAAVPVETSSAVIEVPVESSSAENPVVASSSDVVASAESSSSQKVESSSAVVQKSGIFLAQGTEEEKDYLPVEYKQGTGPDGKSILSYPSQLSTDQKHGIVVWGPGGGTEPAAYEGMIRRLASHGFVVIALRESPGTGQLAKEAIDWLEKENQNPSSPLNGKLDTKVVGCSGHSMGGLESEQAVINDDRVLTAMLNNSGDMGHTAMTKVAKTKTIGIVYGEGGMERPNAEADYGNNGVSAPACLIKMTGGVVKGYDDECYNGECGYGHGSGSWDGMALTVAWMRWHLGGEDFRKADFVGTTGKYIDGNIIGHVGKWKGQCKNF